MKIIMLSGKSGSGKDTAADMMNTIFIQKGYKTLTIHFADLVKFYCKQYFNWNGEKDEYGRTLLQTIGTDIVRKYDEDYWARLVAEFCAATKNKFDICFIPDARFPNEIAIVKQYNNDVITIKIERMFTPHLTEEQLNHPSETSLNDYPDFDYIIENNTDLIMLQQAIETIIEDIEVNKCY